MFCPYCGKEVPSDGRFCPSCGSQLTLPDTDRAAGQPEPDRPDPYSYRQENDRQSYDPENSYQDSYDTQNSYQDNYGPDNTYRESYGPQDPYREDYGNPYLYNDSGAPPAPPAAAKNKKAPLIILTVVVAALLIVLVILVYLFVNQNPRAPKSDPSDLSATEDDRDGSAAQETRDMKLISSDISNYPEVSVYFSIVDGNDDPVILTSPTANITERVSGGAEAQCEIKKIERLENNQGVGMDILIDKSGSMESDFPRMQEVLRSFVNSLDYASGDKAELISFDSLVMYMCALTNNPALLLNGISNMTPDGMTALYDALYAGINNAGSRPGANCVIAFTDGADNESIHTYSEIITLANSKNIPVYLIGTSEADSATLRSIADATGGNYWNVNSISSVSDILNEIYVVQKGMYCVSYTSAAGGQATAQRTITCEIEDSATYAKIENATFTPHEVKETKAHASRYEFVKANVTWNEANEQCIANGGHLVTITDQNEMDKVLAVANQSGVKYIWIGGYTSVRDNYIYGHWVTGESFTYERWDEGEPSRYDRDGAPEAYMMLWLRKGVWSWNDQRNDILNIPGITYFNGNLGYICEYEDN